MIAQRFHAHMLSIINTHVSDIKYVVQRIQDKEFSSKLRQTSNLLATVMTWLESCYLIYLSNGVEPFEETSLAIYNARNVQLMKQHVVLIGNRLLIDIDLTLTLQNFLWSLGQIAEKIATRVSQHKSTNDMNAYERNRKPLLWIRELFGGQAHESYQIIQRSKWLNVMGLEFQNAATFLTLAALRLNTAHFSCQELLEKLAIEGKAVKYGFEQSEWIRLQVAELDTGMKDLEAQLKAFKVEQLRFDDRAFRRESSKNDISTIKQST